MSDVVSELGIKINADAQMANDAIDRLVGKLDRLTISLGGIGTTGNKLDLLSIGVRNLGNAMQLMNNVKTADFTRLAKNLTSLNNVDVSKLTNLSANITKISATFSGLSGMDKAAEQMGMIANGIKQLGYKSADKAITNIPLLASAMKKLMAELSTAPKVSQNLIEMTNALAKLARTGASSGKAADSLVGSFSRISRASGGMKGGLLSVVNGVSSFKRSIMQMLGVAGGFYAVFNGIKSAIDISSDLTEVQNVVDVTFGDYKSKMEDLANVSIPELGMSKLTAKEIGSRFQAMGTAIGFSQGKMSDMSVSLTRLAGDMASFYNVEQKDVAKSLQSIFTGETEPMRKYGVDLTNATLKEWAMKKGMDANISTMSQMQKTALRYQYVLEATGAAQGDFLRTQDTWANQVRILKENFTELASVIGSSFIHALKPLVKALNTAMSAIISFAKVVSNALGKIFGWKYEDTTGGIANDFSDAADSAGDLASGTGAAADNAKKLRQQLQGLDELNVLTTNDSGGSGGSGGGGGAGGSSQDASGGQWTQTDGMLKDFESSLDTLYKLGEYIGNTLTDTLNSINWDSVYEGARNFGSGLASFLNGLISPELFYAVGRTIANSLNTVIYSVLSFEETFDFADFGNSIANGINGFFQNFDFKALAETLNTWVHGIEKTIVEIVKNVDWMTIIKDAFDFATTLDVDTVAIQLAAFSWFHGGKEIVVGSLHSLLDKKINSGIGDKKIPVKASIGLAIAAAYVGWKIGTWAYENVGVIHDASEAIAKWITKDGTTISLPRATAITLTGLTISIGVGKIIGGLTAGTLIPQITASASSIMASLSAWVTGTAIPAITTFCTTTLPTLMAGLANILTFAVPLVLSFLFGWQAGKDLFEAGSGESPSTWGGWKDFFELDATAEEIKKAISDGAVTEFTITPLIKWLADDDSIDTSEVTEAMSEMFSDFMDKTGLGDVVVALTDKDFWKSVPKTWKEIGSDCVKGLTEGLGNVWDKIKGSFEDVKDKISEKLKLDDLNPVIDIETTFKDVKNVGSKLSSWVLDKIRKTGNKSLVKNITSSFSDKNPNSLISWVMKKIKENPGESVTKNISSTLKNKDSNTLVSWVMKKIKENGQSSLTKNIMSKLSKSTASNSLITWLLEKIKAGSKNLTKDVTTGIKKGSSNSLLEWLLEKIRGNKPMSKSVSIGTSISGYSALLTFKNTWDSLKSKTIEFGLKFSALASDLKAWINGNVLLPINVAFSKVPILKHHQIPYLASGGMLDGKGQLFVAREKGPEIVTSYGNKSAVMNNNQIVESVSTGVEIAVRSAYSEQNEILKQQNDILYQILEKNVGISYKDVFNATRKGNNEFKSINGVSAFI